MALLTIDEQRIEKRRNACCCCFVHRRNEATTDEPSNMRASSFTSKCFQILAKAQTLPITKTCILTVTSMLLGFGIYGMTLLKMEFRPEWMLDPETECRNTNNSSYL